MLRGEERRAGAQMDDSEVVEQILLATATGAGTADIVQRLADGIGASCCLIDARGVLLAAAGTPPAPGEIDAVRAALSEVEGGTLLAWRRFPVLAVRRVEGQLLVRRDGAAFGARERVILAAALPALALTLQHERGEAPPPDSPPAFGNRSSLLVGQDPAVLRALTGRLLVPLTAWDEDRGTDLLTTLRTFLETDGRWDATASALDVHVNTVRNRLSRVEELTRTDLGRLDDRVDFVLALQAQDLLRPGTQS